MSTLKKEAVAGVKWTSLSTGIKALLQIVQLIILARFLSAEDFGLVAITMVVIGFSQLFMDMGISNAIIHKQNISDLQLSSLYWLNILSGAVLTIIVFMIAPAVSVFYDNENIIPLLQLLAFSFLISALGNQYRILLRKEMKFNILAKLEVLASVGAFVCSIVLAMQNFGAYALVYATLVNAVLLNTVLLAYGLKTHRPKLVFSLQEIRDFMGFGLYQMGQNSIVYFNNQFDVILIGKLLGTEALGIYSLVKQLVMRPAQIINPIVTNVTFPLMAKIQDDTERLKKIYLKIILLLSSVNFPIYVFMAVLASSLVPVILGQKWIDAVGLFQVLSIYALVRSTMNPAGSLLLAKGRADIGFWWSLSEFGMMPLAIYIGSFWGIVGVALALLVFQTLYSIPNWYFIVKKMCNATFEEYYKQQALPLVLSIFTTLISYAVLHQVYFSNIMKIGIWFLWGLMVYFVLVYIFNKNIFYELKGFVFRSKPQIDGKVGE